MRSIIDDFAAIREARASAEAAETPIGALWRDYNRIGDEGDAAASFEAQQVLYRQCDELIEKITELPATNLDDACVQLDLLLGHLPWGDDAGPMFKLYDSIFAIVRALVGKPPSPSQFEIWYRAQEANKKTRETQP